VSTILITGGSSGIGRACAALLSERGHDVVLVARRLEGLEAAARELPSARVRIIAADVTREEDVARLVERAGPIDVLVNNAGTAAIGPVETFSADDWRRLLDVNLTAVFLCCKAFVPGMKARGRGLIVNMASVAAKTAVPNWSAYCATKFGLVGFSRCLHEEVRKDGVRVTLLYPGGVDTPLWEQFENDFDRARMLRPEDVARALLYVSEQPPELVVDEISLIQAAGLQ
jgi:short-subunit dehydrogenase